MKVTINPDEKTATDVQGRVFKIKGLVIRKPQESKDAFYDQNHSLCKAIVFRGLVMEAIDIGNGDIHLL